MIRGLIKGFAISLPSGLAPLLPSPPSPSLPRDLFKGANLLSSQGSINHTEAITIPKGCILAFRVRQLMVQGKDKWGEQRPTSFPQHPS